MRDCPTIQNGHLTRQHKNAYRADGYLFPIHVANTAHTLKWHHDLELIERDWLDNGLPLPLNTYKRVIAQVVMHLACGIGVLEVPFGTSFFAQQAVGDQGCAML